MTSTPAFTEIPKREGLRVRVAQALRAAIVSGEMEPGDVYSAPSLGQHFGISATPVREALLDLVGEGLMSTVPNKGFRVTEVSERDLAEITELLLLVEPPAVRRAIASILGRDIPALRELARSIVDRASAGDLIGYNEAERRFHLELLGHAGTSASSTSSPACATRRGFTAWRRSWSRARSRTPRPSISSSSTSSWPATARPPRP